MELMNINQEGLEEYINSKWPNLTKNDLYQALALCKAYNLNPALNQVYIIKYGTQPATIVVNYQVILAKAQQNPNYYRFDISYWKDGKELPCPNLSLNDCAGINVLVRIYDKENRMLGNTKWNIQENALANKGTFKQTMFNSWVEKCALVNAFRRTFPNEVQGLYIKEEFDVDNSTGEVTQASKPIRKAPRLSQVFKDANKKLEEQVKEPTKRLEIVESFIKDNAMTMKDFQEGKFDLNDLDAYIKIKQGE